MKYNLTVEYYNQDDGYMVLCREFKHFSAFGDTIEEALHEAGIALQLIIESRQARAAHTKGAQ